MLKILFDFGLVVLIWMTQLVVYPGFTYYHPQNLMHWHKKYTTAVTILVMPLMVGQLLLHILDSIREFDYVKAFTVVILVAVWYITFMIAVPLHNRISAGIEIGRSSQKLVSVNWYRTIGWTLIFLIGFFRYSGTDELFR